MKPLQKGRTTSTCEEVARKRNITWGYTNKMHEGFEPTKNEQSVRVIKLDKETPSPSEFLCHNIPQNIFS